MALTVATMSGYTGAKVVYNLGTMNQINNNISFCNNITSLEVYRGRQQATMISHSGFSLSDTGIIEV